MKKVTSPLLAHNVFLDFIVYINYLELSKGVYFIYGLLRSCKDLTILNEVIVPTGFHRRNARGDIRRWL